MSLNDKIKRALRYERLLTARKFFLEPGVIKGGRRKMDTVPFNKDAVKEYLDDCIRYWRRKGNEAEMATPEKLTAICYIDAFQSVRISLFGKLLKSKE